MLVRFSSAKTQSVLMFGEVAVTLIKMMGASGNVPGAVSASDVPAALARLRKQLEVVAGENDDAADHTDIKHQKDDEPTISLAVRAGPLIQVLERASAAGVAVMWDKE